MPIYSYITSFHYTFCDPFTISITVGSKIFNNKNKKHRTKAHHAESKHSYLNSILILGTSE